MAEQMTSGVVCGHVGTNYPRGRGQTTPEVGGDKLHQRSKRKRYGGYDHE